MDGTGTAARGTARKTARNGLNDRTHDREHDRLLDHGRDLPAPRHGRTGSGNTETKDEQGKRREEREGDFVSYTIAEEIL